MDAFARPMDDLLGLGREIAEVTSGQMALRTIIVYMLALVTVRLGSTRLLAKASAFDMVVAIMLGSIMSRAVNGSAPFVPTIVSGAVLVGAHWLLAALSYRLDWLGPIIKGRPVRLIIDGTIDHDALRRAGISKHDLYQALRTQARTTDAARVRLATLERDGTISVIRADDRAEIHDIPVENGVKTVRIEIGSRNR